MSWPWGLATILHEVEGREGAGGLAWSWLVASADRRNQRGERGRVKGAWLNY